VLALLYRGTEQNGCRGDDGLISPRLSKYLISDLPVRRVRLGRDLTVTWHFQARHLRFLSSWVDISIVGRTRATIDIFRRSSYIRSPHHVNSIDLVSAVSPQTAILCPHRLNPLGIDRLFIVRADTLPTPSLLPLK